MGAASPEIGQLVEDLLREEADFELRDGRSVHRETIARPVTVTLRRPIETTFNSFSRNISGQGIGLISLERVPEDATGILAIEGLSSMPAPILAECRWCKEYGTQWFLSGWQFLMIKR